MYMNDKVLSMISHYDSVMSERNGSSPACLIVTDIKIDGEVCKLTEEDEATVMQMFTELWGADTHGATINNFYWTRLIMMHNWHYSVKTSVVDKDNADAVQKAIDSFVTSFDAYADFSDAEICKFYDEHHTAEVVEFEVPDVYYVPLPAAAFDVLDWANLFMNDADKYDLILKQLVWEFIMHGPMSPIKK